MPTRYVYDFAEGDKDQKDLLGGKGANLAEMTRLGLPGAAGVHHHHRGVPGLPAPPAPSPDGLRRARSTSTCARLEDGAWAAGSATPDDPLLVSRALGGEVLDARDDGDRPQHRPERRVACTGWPSRRGDERFAWDSYRRLIQMFGKTVLGIDGEALRARARRAKDAQGRHRRPRPRRRRPAASSSTTLQGDRRASTPAATSRRTRASSWTSPIRAVFDSWNTDRAPCSTAGRSASRTTWAPR